MMLSALLLLGWVLPASASSLSYPTALVVNENGGVTGADNIWVGNYLYNVEFKNGTCNQLYSGCDEASDFAFLGFNEGGVQFRENPNPFGPFAYAEVEGVLAALDALDRLVFQNSWGNLLIQPDTNPTSTKGCSYSLLDNPTRNCEVLLPYAMNGSDEIYFASFNNANLELNDEVNYQPYGLLDQPLFDDQEGLCGALFSGLSPCAEFEDLWSRPRSANTSNNPKRTYAVFTYTGVSLAPEVVPIPATAWLLGSALGLLGWMRRKAS